MTPNERILASAHAIMRGALNAPASSGLCLALTRIIIENAFSWPSHYWYLHYVTDWVQPPGYDRSRGHWARDAERSLRRLGMNVHVSERKPGDLVFNWRSAWSNEYGAFIGHVGVLVDGDMILENINPSFRAGRAFSRGATSLTPFGAWERVTLVARFVPEQ